MEPKGLSSRCEMRRRRGSCSVKIAQIAPLVESVPPRLYGGTERVVSWLTEELVAQGHDVTLFASGDSRTKAKLAPIVPRALRLDGIHNSLPYNIIMLDQVAERMAEFDVLHFHIDFFHYPIFRNMAHRTLTTLHGRQDLPELPDIYRAFPHMPLVSISQPSAKAGAAGQLDGHGLSRPAGEAVSRRRRQRRLSGLSGPHLCRQGPGGRHRHRAPRPACASKWRPRWTLWTGPISRR